MATINSVNSGLIGTTGTGNFVGSNGGSLFSPQISTSILDASGNTMLTLTNTASAVNYFTMTNAATTGSPAFGASGSDTNVILTLNAKGTGGVMAKGTSTNNNASAGYIGEFISSEVLNASAVTPGASGTPFNITSISLTAGDWDVWGNIRVNTGSASDTSYLGWTNTVSAAGKDNALIATFGPATAISGICFTVPYARYSLSATTTTYLSARLFYTGAAPTASGGIYARRAR